MAVDPNAAVGGLVEAFEEVLDLGLDLRILHGLAAWSMSIIMARWKCDTAPATAPRRWKSHLAGQWRKLSTGANLMVDPGRGARCAIRDIGAPGEAVTIGPLPYWASLTQWRQSGLGRLGRHDALLANGSLARLFWGVLDAFDYWLTQARLGIVDTVCGPEPPTVADEKREADRGDRDKWFP
jgi:hypothetical protein